jgi:hypothetical protein
MILGGCHNNFFAQMPKYQIPNVWFGMALKQVQGNLAMEIPYLFFCLNWFQTPFFGGYSLHFRKSS